jgi:chaperonin GroEL
MVRPWVHQPVLQVRHGHEEAQSRVWEPFILLSRKKILLLQDILPSLGTAAQARRPIIAEDVDVDWEALVACLLNKLRGQLQVAAVKALGFIDNRKSILGDLAFWTRGTVLT